MKRGNAVVAALSIAALVGCASSDDDGPRFRDSEGQFSMAALDGWTQTQERGTVVFYGPADQGLSETSIAVRSVARADVGNGTAGAVTAATKTALQGLPGAQVRGEAAVAHDGLTGVQYEVTFSPRKAKGKRYARTHVVLVSGDRVFHVLHTAPEGTLADTAPLFEQVVESFRQEG